MEDDKIIIIDKSLKNTGEREILFVSKELVNTIKTLGEIEGIKCSVRKSYADFKDEIEINQETIEKTADNIKRVSLTVQDQLKNVMETETIKLYEAWEELNKNRTEISVRLLEFRHGIDNIKDDINELKKAISGINIYGMENLLKIVKEFQNMSTQDKEILKNLFLLKERSN